MRRGRRNETLSVDEIVERKKKDYQKRLEYGGIDKIIKLYNELPPHMRKKFLEDIVPKHRAAREAIYRLQAEQEAAKKK